MKIEVPPPPVSAFAAAPMLNTAPKAAKPKDAELLDARFVRRSLGWTGVLGACLSLAAYSATHSGGVAASFALGVALGAGLLWSEMALIGRVLQASADAKRGKSSGKKKLLAAVWVAKWLPVAGGMWLLFRALWFVPFAFALGCLVFQVVIFAKAAGRLLAR